MFCYNLSNIVNKGQKFSTLTREEKQKEFQHFINEYEQILIEKLLDKEGLTKKIKEDLQKTNWGSSSIPSNLEGLKLHSKLYIALQNLGIGFKTKLESINEVNSLNQEIPGIEKFYLKTPNQNTYYIIPSLKEYCSQKFQEFSKEYNQALGQLKLRRNDHQEKPRIPMLEQNKIQKLKQLIQLGDKKIKEITKQIPSRNEEEKENNKQKRADLNKKIQKIRLEIIKNQNELKELLIETKSNHQKQNKKEQPQTKLSIIETNSNENSQKSTAFTSQQDIQNQMEKKKERWK